MAIVLIAVFVLFGVAYAAKNLTMSPTGDVILNPAGKVGIKTTGAPAYELDVNGTINATAIYVGGEAFSGGGSVPAKTIAAFYRADCPTGWTIADGANGTPDLRGIFIRGAGTSTHYQKANGSYYGATYDTYYTDMMQGHWHDFARSLNGVYAATDPDNVFGSGVHSSNMVQDPIADSTNGTPRTGAETAPASFALTYCMKTGTDDTSALFEESGGVITTSDPADQLHLTNLVAPTDDADAATKSYVDASSTSSDQINSLTANSGMYNNKIASMTPPAAYTEVCFKSGATTYDYHASSESTAGGNCVPGDTGFIIEKNERTAAYWELAKQTCLQYNMRLAEPFEWKLSCKNAGTWSLSNMTGNWEWASNFSLPMYTGSYLGIGAAVFGYSGCGYANWYWVGYSDGSEYSNAFRCAR